MWCSRLTATPARWPICSPIQQGTGGGQAQDAGNAPRRRVRYLDFTPMVMVSTACSVIGARYLAMGTGDKALYIVAGMLAAVIVSVRFLLFRGAGKAD
ncbi:MAG: hypothetical protein R3F37_16635 [Candidatus Competibacteraceae bacterium]